MRSVKALLVGLALLALPSGWAHAKGSFHNVGHCDGCGVAAPACGCDDVVHCSSCAPRCGCCCLRIPPVIPCLLNGIDRALTRLLTCRPRCCDPWPSCGCGGGGCSAGCDSCGGGHDFGPSMDMHPLHSPIPADMMVNPFEDDPVQARRAPIRGGSRYGMSPARRPAAPRQASTRYAPAPTAAPRTAPPQDRTAQLATRSVVATAKPTLPPAKPTATRTAADEPPRIARVDYARPIPAPAAAETAPTASRSGQATLRSVGESRPAAASLRSPIPASSGSVPHNPLRD